MIDRFLGFALNNRVLILLFAILLVGLGIRALLKIPIDAFPDVTNIQVQVIAEAPGRSPVEVEKFVTAPIEVGMSGLPGLTELRSVSMFGLSTITIVFEDNVDIYFARQLVLERLIEAKESLPEGISPVLAPISTGLGEIYQYTLERPESDRSIKSLMDLRTTQDWMVRPLLKTVPGVADVNSWGGYVKQYQILVDPDRLFQYEVSLREVFEAVAENNANAGGGFLLHGSEQYLVRGVGLVRSIADIGNIVVKERAGVPVFVKDVAQVVEGPEPRQGAAIQDAKGEVMVGIVMMIRGGSGRDIAKRVKEKVAEINHSGVLPGGAQIKPFYDRTDLVRAAIKTVTEALIEGGILVVIVLFLFLGNARSALIVALTLPLSALFAFIIMQLPQINLSANLMTLGGLAIAIGMMVDGSVVIVENIFRHLSEHMHEHESKMHAVSAAAKEVASPMVFGILIIIIVFLPLFTLEGIEGKMFAPLAFAISAALLGSLIISLMLSPVLCTFFLKGASGVEDLIVRKLKQAYRPALQWHLNHEKLVIFVSVLLLIFALAIFPFLGTEFIPQMDEGSVSPMITRLPSISLDESVRLENEVQKRIMQFPEVESAVAKIGAAEISTDPQGPNVSDPIVTLKPRSHWKTAKTKEELVEKMREAIEQVPGIAVSMSQPIAVRVDELISGVKSQIAVKIFGDEMEVLKKKADEISAVLSTVRGVTDLRAEQVSGQPYLDIEIDRSKIARYGINVADIQEVIETAVAGKTATDAFEGEKRFDISLRFPEKDRNNVDAIGKILISTSDGSRIPLAEVANLTVVDGPVQISREDVKRRIVVECNVSDRDIGSFVAEAQRKIRAGVQLPAGYFITWGGAFENQQRAMRRLMIIVPITIGLIFFLLYSAFHSFRQATLIIINLPFALIGGIVALFVSGLYLSVPASVGFIALFGVAVLNGIVLVSYINQLRAQGLELREAVVQGCERRLRPVLMTALVTALGLIPLLFARGTGSEIQRPLATVVIGGLISSTLLTLLVLPAIYGHVELRKTDVEI